MTKCNAVKIMLIVGIAVAIGMYACDIGFAQTLDPFAKASKKGEELYKNLLTILQVVCGLAICVAGVGMMLNKIPRNWAIGIISGSLVAGSAMELAKWLMS